MKIKTVLILLFLSLVICLSLQSQTVTNTTSYKIPPQDAAWLKSQGWTDEQITNAIPIQNQEEPLDNYQRLTNDFHTAHLNYYHIGSLVIIVPTSPQDQISTISIMGTHFKPVQSNLTITNKDGYVIPAQDVAYFRSQGYSDAEIESQYQPPASQQQVSLPPTPDDLKNAVVCMDSFLGMTNAMFPADVISMKLESLKFRINGQDYNYSGHYTVTLNTPRKHKNPYLGLGSPDTAKILILEDWGGNMMPLENATIWEKSNGFIDAVAGDKEWIYSGTYTIQN